MLPDSRRRRFCGRPLAQALGQSGGKRQFRFPHFYIVGFQKCATTSLFQ